MAHPHGLQALPDIGSTQPTETPERRIPADRTPRLPRLPEIFHRQSQAPGRRRRLRRLGVRRGRYIRARRLHSPTPDIAWDATLRAAATQTIRQGHSPKVLHRAVNTETLREKERALPAGHLVLFVVDASWSMAVGKRMEATKGAVLRLLQEAYRRRERVGMIVFRRTDAQLILPPTRSIHLARRALQEVPVGGKTPLAAGLALAFEVIRRERLRTPHVQPYLVVLTDGAGNVSLTGKDPLTEAYTWAERLARLGVQALVINMEQPEYDRGLAQTLARHLRAACITPLEWTPQYLAAQVRKRMAQAAREGQG